MSASNLAVSSRRGVRRIDVKHLVWLCLASFLGLTACDIPARRAAPYPRLSTKGFLGTTSIGDGAPAAREDLDRADPAPTIETTTGFTSAIVRFDADIVGYLGSEQGLGWEPSAGLGAATLLHRDESGRVDATLMAMRAPLLPGRIHLDHVVRWHLLKVSEVRALAAGIYALLTVAAVAPPLFKAVWSVGSVSDAVAFSLISQQKEALPLPVAVVGKSFTGWRWTGVNDFGVHVRFGAFDGTVGDVPWSDWSNAFLSELSVATLRWAQRAPKVREEAGRLLRSLRLHEMKTSQTCKPFASCLLQATAPPVADGSGLPSLATQTDGNTQGFAGIYDESGRLVAKAERRQVSFNGDAIRWRWRAGRPGRFLLQWSSDGGNTFDPAMGKAVRIDVGDAQALGMSVAIGYLDQGRHDVEASFVVAACRKPCAVGGSIAAMLQSLCFQSDRRCIERFLDHMAGEDGRPRLEDSLVDLTSTSNKRDSTNSILSAVSGWAERLDSDDANAKEQFLRWWKDGVDTASSPTSAGGSPDAQ